MKTTTLLLTATALFAASPALAAVQPTSYTFASQTSLPGGVFSGTFSLGKTADGYDLTAFSATYGSTTFDLTNAGIFKAEMWLIGGDVNGRYDVRKNTNDFQLFFDPSQLGMTRTINELRIASATSVVAYGDVAIIATAALAPSVPEPDTWAMMLVGFGMLGGAARYSRRTRTVSFA